METTDRRARSTARRRIATAALWIAGLTAIAAAMPAAASRTAPPEGKGKGAWTQAAPPTAQGKIRAKKLRALDLNRAALAQVLAEAPRERTRPASDALVLDVPAPGGGFQRFAVVESPVMDPALAARHPEIKTYAGTGIDDPSATLRADLTPLGFHASVRSAGGAWYVDPYFRRDDRLHVTYYGRDLESPEGEHDFKAPLSEGGDGEDASVAAAVPEGPAVQLRTYRLALLSDPSYATYFGAENVTAAKVTLVNRVTQIYEEETAIRLVLIGENDALNLNTTAAMTGANGPCGANACFTAAQATGCTSGTLGRNRIVIGQLVGASAYDVGHIIFGLPGGGVASLASVGGNTKAQGCTGLPEPVGDFFAVDYVAHELGHQFAGNHTFNGNQHNCSGGNRSQANSVEPGSGSSIMAYAGICRHDNLQPHSDPYWSQRSYQEITTFVTSARAPINEVQTVSLRDFDGTDSFTLSFGGVQTAPIVRGTSYTTAAIDAAIEAVVGAGSVLVAAWGGSGALNDGGFQVTFNGAPVNATNVGLLGLNVTGATGFVGETAKGGAVDNGGHLVTETGNHAPVVEAPMAYAIPTRTPFALTGSATDSDGHPLTYLWEQNDRGGAGGAGGTALVNNVKVNGPLFRQFGTALQMPPYDPAEYEADGENHPDGNATRVFPDLGQILANNTNAATGTCPAFTGVWPETVPLADVDCYSEFLPTADWVGFGGDRTLNFRFTVRDSRPGGGGVGTADTRVTVVPTAGPFLVTSQAAAASLPAGSIQAVTWDVAGTDLAPIGAAEVKVSLSTDGGWTYPHVLAESTPNDGSEPFQLPNVDTSEARIRVEAVGNVFFDVSAIDFTIRGAATQLAELVAFSTGQGTGTSLESKARVAAASLARGSVGATCSGLVAFLNEVAAQAGKSLTPAQAAELTERAQLIRAALGC